MCLDTSIIIDFLKGRKRVVELVKSYSSKEKVSTTTITEYELLKHKDKIKREIAEMVLDSMEVYTFDRKAALEASRIFEKLNASGKTINEDDILIAGIAASNGETLLTEDKDFEKIESKNIIIV